MSRSFFNHCLGFLIVLVSFGVNADTQVVSGLINSDQTYVVNDQGESIQEFKIGQQVFVILDPKDSKDKKRKDFYRVAFDPTNLKGDGWVYKDKVKLMTNYRSIDGKEPTEYADRPAPVPSAAADKRSSATASSPTEASTFLEELIKRDEQKPELKSITQAPPAAAPKKTGKNPLENDLEFLFQQDGEFKETFKEAKATLKEDYKKKIGVSNFTGGRDLFANQVMEIFSTRLKKDKDVSVQPQIAFAPDLENAGLISVPADVNGVFFGQMSPKIGDARLLKIKYYDRTLKQFTFEKVAKIPLNNPNKTVEAVADEGYRFVSK